MRLSGWRSRAPSKEAVAPKVVAVVESALATLGADPDPDCWIAWGDDPSVRYLVLAPTPGGLIQLNVRVNAPGEGPRASGKVIRWNRVQLGELGVEIQGGHRLVTFQVATVVLNGSDALADDISEFARVLMAAVDGRPLPPPARGTGRRTTVRGEGATTAKPRATTTSRAVARR